MACQPPQKHPSFMKARKRRQSKVEEEVVRIKLRTFMSNFMSLWVRRAEKNHLRLIYSNFCIASQRVKRVNVSTRAHLTLLSIVPEQLELCELWEKSQTSPILCSQVLWLQCLRPLITALTGILQWLVLIKNSRILNYAQSDCLILQSDMVCIRCECLFLIRVRMLSVE